MRNFESFVNSILTEWSANSSDGIPSLDESGVDSLYNSLISNGLNEEEAYGITSLIAEKGKYPERQAYNKNGLLVTFPTPEYKARAIARGTHFEKNPKVSQSNLFGGGQLAPNQPSPTTTSTPQTTSPSDGSELPKSDIGGTPSKGTPEPGTSDTPPVSVPSPSQNTSQQSGGITQTPAQGQLATEPIQPSSQPQNVSVPPQPPQPPPVKKTPEEIAAEKEVIKQILNTGDTLPTVAGVGGSGIAEQQLRKLLKVAVEMELNEAIKILSKLL